METELNSGSSVSGNGDEPQNEITNYLDTMCPYYLHYGMTWNEFWYGPIEQLSAYWQKHQFDIEGRNQEMWVQGLYIRMAVASCLDSKSNKYPEKPNRLTPMTEAEQEAENKRIVEKLREQLIGIKARWDAKHKGDDK